MHLTILSSGHSVISRNFYRLVSVYMSLDSLEVRIAYIALNVAQYYAVVNNTTNNTYLVFEKEYKPYGQFILL